MPAKPSICLVCRLSVFGGRGWDEGSALLASTPPPWPWGSPASRASEGTLTEKLPALHGRGVAVPSSGQW